jgi:hypothetical protein
MSLDVLKALEGRESPPGNTLPPSSSQLPVNRIIRSPAQNYALVIGAALTLAGIVGFFYSGSFGDPGKVDDVLGVLDVNGWHNLVHLFSGLLGLAVARSYSASRAYAIGFGAVYAVVAIWGFVIGDGESILGFLPVNSEDNVLHLLIALAGIFAGLGTAATPRPSARGTDEPETTFRELKI